MNGLLKFYASLVGRKVLMAVTGFFLFSFLTIHLYINLFVFMGDGGGTFDSYAEFMATYPLLRPIEIILFLGFTLHAFTGIILWYRNRNVRPIGYAVDNTGKRSTFSSRIVIYTGAVVLVFLAWHIKEFFIQSRFIDTDKSMYQLVSDTFLNQWTVILYLLSLIFLGFHLKHAFQSAFQTLGIRLAKYQLLIDLIAVIFWLVFPLLFAAIPVYFICLSKGWIS